MEGIKNLLLRFRQSGTLVLIGFFVIIYIAFGFVYWQQNSQQKELEDNSVKVAIIVNKPLPSMEKLQAEYNEANFSLAPVTDSDAIAILVSVAEKSGIDTNPDNNKLRIPSALGREERVGGGTYKIWSFRNVSVQGDYDSVMAFVSDLDSGLTQETMVLKRVDIRQVEVQVVSEGEGEGKGVSRIEIIATLDVDLYAKSGG